MCQALRAKTNEVAVPKPSTGAKKSTAVCESKCEDKKGDEHAEEHYLLFTDIGPVMALDKQCPIIDWNGSHLDFVLSEQDQ